jgi:hypothetical protein
LAAKLLQDPEVVVVIVMGHAIVLLQTPPSSEGRKKRKMFQHGAGKQKKIGMGRSFLRTGFFGFDPWGQNGKEP